MDVLSEILERMRISGSLLAELRCGGDWGLDTGVREEQGVHFHYVVQGECWLISDATPMRLATGDLVAAPHWPFHGLASSPDQPLVLIRELVTARGLPRWTGGTLDRPLVIEAGENPGAVRILSGFFTFKGQAAAMLIDQLPAILHMRAEGLEPQLETALNFMDQESVGLRPGYVAVAARMMDLLFIQILRAIITEPLVKTGFLAALSDPSLARALAAIHADPAIPWTVAALASEACLSRTVFANRFRETVGVTPLRYVNHWRLTVAEDLLRSPGISIEGVRQKLGFNSGFAFARAFRAQFGMAPREFRQSALLAAPNVSNASVSATV